VIKNFVETFLTTKTSQSTSTFHYNFSLTEGDYTNRFKYFVVKYEGSQKPKLLDSYVEIKLEQKSEPQPPTSQPPKNPRFPPKTTHKTGAQPRTVSSDSQRSCHSATCYS